jgi:hypothetical protein
LLASLQNCFLNSLKSFIGVVIAVEIFNLNACSLQTN